MSMRSMGHRVLFDTNTLIDAVNSTRAHSEAACRALEYCNGGGDMGIVSPSSLNDAYYVLRKQYGEPWARKAIKLLLDLLVVLPFGPEECIISADSDEPDFEDGMIRAAAELNDVDFILTRDGKAFNHSTVRSITCETYLEIIASEDREAITTLRESVINS